VVGDPRGAGDVLAGVAEGLTVCDGLGDRVGEGEVCVGEGVGVDVVDEVLAAGWVVPGGAGAGPGLTRM
jgi:hypothetical protein